jgi:hypothetical protein
MIRTEVTHFTLVRQPWSIAAEEGLQDTFFGALHRIRAGVNRGRMELYRVNGESWCVLERMPDMFFIWCYQGRGLVDFIHKMTEYAHVNGFSSLSFFTHMQATRRALRSMNPEILTTKEPGEMQFIIDTQRCAQRQTA